MTDALLIIHPLHAWPGQAPEIPAGAYTGYFDSGLRQWIFVFDEQTRLGRLYVSGTGWTREYNLENGRLPDDIILTSSESAWALACWRAAQTGHRTRGG